jgi:uncharacterized repeat protein (TIGR01451 family)
MGIKWLFSTCATAALLSCGDRRLTPPAGALNIDLVVTKTVNKATAPEGDTLVWTVTVTNAGPIAATSVVAGDTVPTGTTFVSGVPTVGTYADSGLWTIDSLAAGASAQLTLLATINAGAGGTNLLNRAGATSLDQNDSVPSNNIASATTAATAAALNNLVFTTLPAGTTAGTGFGVVVTARNGLGSTVTGYTGNVTVAITSGTGTAGAHLTGTTTVAAVAGVATFSGLAIDSAGSGYSLAASATLVNGATSATFNIAAGTASQLVFTTQPGNATAGAGFGAVVKARDALGNAATGFAGSVTVAITGGTGTTGAHLTGTVTVAAVLGVATFSGLAIDSAGAGYSLSASATGLNGATSAAFNIAASAPAQLAFTTQPGNTTAGVGFGVVVTVRNGLGSTATGFTDNVTVAITAGTGTAFAHLTGTTTVAAVAGVATFSGLAIDSAGSGYSLAASANLVNGATSATFNIAAGAAAQLAFTTQPGNTTAGVGFGTVVTARDALGNTATVVGNVTVAITSGTGATGAHLTGTATVAAVLGVATFSGLAIDSAGTGYKLTASATGPSGATSAPFNIVAGAASQLAFTTQPPDAAAGIGFGAVVRARDSQGNTAAFAGNVTVSIATGTAGAHLTGTVTAAAVAGVATFSGLTIDSVGTGYRLAASAGGLASGTSTTFNITAAVASQLVFTTQPGNATAGAGFGVVVTARNGLGNTATGFTGSVTVAITAGTGTTGAHLTGTATLAAVLGVATFTGLAIDSAGSGYKLTASATGPSNATSATFNIVAGAASQLAFTTQPPNAAAGTGFGAVVRARDAQGNTATGFTASVTVAITAGTGTTGAHLTGTATLGAVLGVASFSALAIDSAGVGYKLTASATVPSGATSSTFNITAAAATGEPVYNSATQALIRSDGFDYANFAAAVAGGWTGVNNGTAQDVTTNAGGANLFITPGRDGTGSAMRLRYDGIDNSGGANQEGHSWSLPLTDNLAGRVGHAIYVSYWFRITAGGGNTLDVVNGSLLPIVKVKWFELWNANGNSRAQFNTSYAVAYGGAPTGHPGGTIWQFFGWSGGNTTNQAEQARAPWAWQGAGQWHHVTHKYVTESAFGARDGIAQMWYDGTLIISVTAADVNQVVPNSGLTDIHGITARWCQNEDLDSWDGNRTTGTHVDQAVSRLTLGSVHTYLLWPFTIDYDEFMVWRD